MPHTLFRTAAAATAAIDLIRAGQLIEQAIDDYDVRKHYADGAELVDDFADKKRQLHDPAVPGLLELAQPCVVRERCRLRASSGAMSAGHIAAAGR